MLQNAAYSADVEWTLFSVGWFVDYLLPQEKTYLRHDPRDRPIDIGRKSVSIKGTGDEPVSWTCCREIGRAVVELLKAEKWVS